MRNFGGMATSRLNRNLRLEKHWSYGTAGFLNGARGPRNFAVFAPVQTDKTKESMVEVRKEILGLEGERPLAGEELDSILRSQVARLPGRFETLDSLVAAALDMVNTGRAPEYYYDYSKNLQALDGADERRDAAELGGGAGGDHDAAALSGGDEAAGIGHALAVAQRGVGGGGRGGLVAGH